MSEERLDEGLSAFIGRVFDQLSITSWLPAVFLVGNASVLLTLQGDEKLSFTGAIKDLVKLQWGALIVLLFAVVIVAMLIQAFEFENLRFWEGYLRSKPMKWWAAKRIRRFQKKLIALETDFERQQRTAFDDARQRELDDETTAASKQRMWNAMEKVIHDRRLDADEASEADRAATDLDWPSFAAPNYLHAWEITKLKLSEFPEPHRLLPTRLGNVMRAAEDHVKLGVGEGLEGFMIRHMDELPATIVSEHAAYRRRLEMYCGLMFVLGSLVPVSIACFWGNTDDMVWRIAIPVLYACAVWIAYKAAIASALGFGQALKEASDWLQRAEDEAYVNDRLRLSQLVPWCRRALGNAVSGDR